MGSKRKSYRDINVKNSRIDRATGRNRRDNTRRASSASTGTIRPVRQNGRIVRGGRLAFTRARRMRGGR